MTQELDLISIKCIKIQRQLSEVTVTHRIGDILESKNEEESAKKSEPETKKHIGGDDNEMKWNHVYVWSFLIFTPCNKIQKDEPRKIFSIENANKNFPFNIQVF